LYAWYVAPYCSNTKPRPVLMFAATIKDSWRRSPAGGTSTRNAVSRAASATSATRATAANGIIAALC
jgi:hypothetical protein